MRKLFFYKKDLKNFKILQDKEFDILVKKLFKIKLNYKQKFNTKFANKLIKKNFCLKTGRRHSVNSFYYLSRMCFKELFREKLLNGLRRISW